MRARNNEHLKKNLTDVCLQIIHMTELLNYDSHPEFIDSGIDDGVNLYITSIGGERYVIHIPNEKLDENVIIDLISNVMARQEYPPYVSNLNYNLPSGLTKEYF